MDTYTTIQVALILGILVCVGGMALAFVAQMRRADETQIAAEYWQEEARIAHETVGLLWDRIYFLNDENDALKQSLFQSEHNCELLEEMVAEYRQENNRF